MSPGVVVLTASAGSFPGLAESLRAEAVAVEERPLVRFAPPDDWAPLDAALDATRDAVGGGAGGRSTDGPYTAIAFTSPRAAEAFASRVAARRRRDGAPALPEIWAAGAGTARALAAIARDVRTPSEQEVGRRGAAAALASTMLDAGIGAAHDRADRVLFPCGDHRRDELPARLRERGVEVHEVVCYRSVLATDDEARAAAARAAVLVVASPSVAGLLGRACPVAPRPALLAVGPVTAAACRDAGWPPAAIAAHPTSEAVGAAARALLL